MRVKRRVFGGSFGAVIGIYYGVAGAVGLGAPACDLVGALITTGAALLLSRGGGTLGLILAGAAISALAAAGVDLALNLAPSPYAAYEITTWLMGSLADRNWDHVRLAAPFILAGAEQARLGERISQQALQHRAGQTEDGADQQRQDRTRGPDVDQHQRRQRRLRRPERPPGLAGDEPDQASQQRRGGERHHQAHEPDQEDGSHRVHPVR